MKDPRLIAALSLYYSSFCIAHSKTQKRINTHKTGDHSNTIDNYNTSLKTENKSRNRAQAQLTLLSRFYRVRDNESGFKGAHKSATGPGRSFYAFSRKIVKLAAILPGHVSRIKNNEGRLK